MEILCHSIPEIVNITRKEQAPIDKWQRFIILLKQDWNQKQPAEKRTKNTNTHIWTEAVTKI